VAESRTGFFDHALELLAAAWGYLRTRLELAQIEGREAVVQYLKALGLLLGGIVVLVFGYFFFFALATALGGGTAWIWVTLGAAALHFAAGAVLLVKVRALVQSPVFPVTLDEFKKDQAWLETKTPKQN
jgi:uncharacterized membrane protein YqjE